MSALNAWRAYRVPGDRQYPRGLRKGQYVITDPNAGLVTGEEIIVLTATGKRLLAGLIGYDDKTLILSGLNDHDDDGVWVDTNDIAQTEAVAGFYSRRDFLPSGVIHAGDLSAPL